MIKHEIMEIIESMISENHAAVLSTVDLNGAPHMRWVTPGCLEERSGAIYMISAVNFSKIEQIRANPQAEMLLQTKMMDQIINIQGRVNILDNPSIRSEVLECIAKHLHEFWNVNRSDDGLVVLEMVIELVTVFYPQKGSRMSVDFISGA